MELQNWLKTVPVPVLVKETGAGINAEIAQKLLSVGVQVIDIAGAGGTSWARVENLRSDDSRKYAAFDNWGLPTVDCLVELHALGIAKKQDYSLRWYTFTPGRS